MKLSRSMNLMFVFAIAGLACAAGYFIAGQRAPEQQEQLYAGPQIVVPSMLVQHEQPIVQATQASMPVAARPGECLSGANCPYAKQVRELKADLRDADAKYDHREAQWNRWFDDLDDYVRRHGLSPLHRYSGRRDGTSGDAVNDGLYGEGRPATGTYGHTHINPYGKVQVNCPDCQRKFN